MDLMKRLRSRGSKSNRNRPSTQNITSTQGPPFESSNAGQSNRNGESSSQSISSDQNSPIRNEHSSQEPMRELLSSQQPIINERSSQKPNRAEGPSQIPIRISEFREFSSEANNNNSNCTLVDELVNFVAHSSSWKGQGRIERVVATRLKALPPPRHKYNGVSKEKTVYTNYNSHWAEYLNNNLQTDFILISKDGAEVPVHSVTLAGISPIFKSLLLTTFSSSQKKLVLNMPKKILDQILSFAYEGKCEISIENAEELLRASHSFQILGISQLASEYLINSLTPQNCLSIYKNSKALFCSLLSQKAKLFILYNFRKVLEQGDFLNLDYEDMEDLLRDDLLNIRNEEMVFEAIKRWVEFAPESREGRLMEILQCIRFGLMNYRYFTNEVLPWRYISTNLDVHDSIFEAQMFLASMESRNGLEVDLNDPIARPRVPYEIIFAIGGWSAGSPTSFMETYDARADRWFLSQGSDVTPRAYHGLVSLGNLIYMIGGFDGQDHFNTMRCYDPLTRTWTEKSNMHFPRCYISCCVLDGKIYAMGGFNGRTRMNSVEVYDPTSNQWEQVASMNRQRSDASACALNGKVYVAGGFNGQEVLNSVEVYDPVENTWSYIHAMRSPRSGVVLTAYKEHLYAIGGFNGFTRLSTAERYNPKEPSEWELVAEMSSPRSNFAAAVIDDMIFVIGGFNGTTTIPFVECYESGQNEWFDAAHMNLNRSALAACVLRGLPNARDYSYLSRVQELLGLEPQAQFESRPQEHQI